MSDYLFHYFIIIWLFFVIFPSAALARITVTLPKGKSSVELLSPNYPESFPDDDVMEWYFELPLKHKAVVQLLEKRQPHCLKKSIAIEYNATGVSVRSLTETQPDQTKGNFTMKLRNCEMDRRDSPGLSLSFKVSSSSISSPGLYINCMWCCAMIYYVEQRFFLHQKIADVWLYWWCVVNAHYRESL